MIGILDGNNFFVSCERLFRPDLRFKPVVVLSNNDRNIISRSNEVKEIGIKMGAPLFQVKHLIEKHNVHLFSSNYALYGNISERMFDILSSLVPSLHIYSIDEAFIYTHGRRNMEEYARHIVKRVHQCIGIPVSLGMGQTHTLSKIASKLAKKYPKYENVCIIDTEYKRIKALQHTDVSDIWGIGREYTSFLNSQGVKTAYDLTCKTRSWIREYMTVLGEKTWLELQGVSCISVEEVEQRKQICTSRSFDEPITDYNSLILKIADYAASCSVRLREQKSLTQGIIVFLNTSRFKDPYYSASRLITLSHPTLDTGEIIKHSKKVFPEIFKDGLEYKKAGVILTGNISQNNIQFDLFDKLDRDKQKKLSQAIDTLNYKFGKDKVRSAAQSITEDKNFKREFLSKNPVSCFNDAITIRV